MKHILLTCILTSFLSCGPKEKQNDTPALPFKDLVAQYHQDQHHFFPMEATIQGAEGFNDLLTLDVTEGFRRELKNYFVGLKKNWPVMILKNGCQ